MDSYIWLLIAFGALILAVIILGLRVSILEKRIESLAKNNYVLMDEVQLLIKGNGK